MQVYPGYTVRKIEEELSYREIDELIKHSKEHPPHYANLRVIKEMIAAYLGIDLSAVTEEPTIEKAVEAFKLLGMI